MRIKSMIISALVLFVLSAYGYCADWPAFRGLHASGFSSEKGINKNWKQKSPKILWKVSMHDDGFAGPSVSSGTVFIVDHRGSNDIVRAINLATGKKVWQYIYADAGSSNYGFTRSTPVINNGKLYILSRMGLFLCLNASSGKKVWSVNLKSAYGGNPPNWDYAGSTLVDGNRVIVCPGGRNAAVAALDKNTGKTIWQGGGSDRPGYATPVKASFNGRSQYVVFTASNVIGVDSSNGKLIWSIPWKTNYDVNAATPVPIGNSVFITSGYGRGCALIEIAKNGKARIRWENREIQSHFSSPIASKGYIYGTTDPGDLVCLDMKNGKAKWRRGGFEKGGLCAVDGTIIAMNGSGGDVIMVQMSPSGYREFGRINPLGGQSWTAPIIADGKLIIRNKSSLACLSLK